MANWKKIGTVGPPQGLGGSFFLVGKQERKPSLPSIVIGEDPSCGIPAIINSKKLVQGQWILSIRGVEGREALEGIRGQDLWIDLGDQEDCLEGVRIIDTDGTELGRVVALENHGASDVLVIESPEQKYLDLPLVEDFFALPASNGVLELVMPRTALSDLWYE